MGSSTLPLQGSSSSRSLSSLASDSKIAPPPGDGVDNGVSERMLQGIEKRPSSVPLTRRAPVMVRPGSYNALPIAQLPVRGRSDSLESNQSLGSNASGSSQSVESQPLSRERCLDKVAELSAKVASYIRKPEWTAFAETLSGITRLSKRIDPADGELQQHVTGLLAQLTQAQQTAQFRVDEEEDGAPLDRESKDARRDSAEEPVFHQGPAREGMLSIGTITGLGEPAEAVGDLALFNPFAAEPKRPMTPSSAVGASPSKPSTLAVPLAKSDSLNPPTPRNQSAGVFGKLRTLVAQFFPRKDDKADLTVHEVTDQSHPSYEFFKEFCEKEFSPENLGFLRRTDEYRKVVDSDSKKASEVAAEIVTQGVPTSLLEARMSESVAQGKVSVREASPESGFDFGGGARASRVEVNLSSQLKAALAHARSHGATSAEMRKAVTDARHCIVDMVSSDTLPRFLKSDLYQAFKKGEPLKQ